MLNPAAVHASPAIWVQFWPLTKPRVVSLIVFTAVIGMLLATPTFPAPGLVFAATIGIALVAGAAAAFNCLVEHKIDAVMARTRGRPTVVGTISALQILLFSGVVGGLGLAILWHAVNPLTMWLTLCTFVGYAIVYTVILKPATPQNIVIGGAVAAVRERDGGILLPGLRIGPRRRVPRLRHHDLAALQRRARQAHLRVFDLLPRDDLRGVDGRPLPATRSQVRIVRAAAAAL